MKLSVLLVCALALSPVVAAQEVAGGWRRIADNHGSSLEVPGLLLRRVNAQYGLSFVGSDGTRVTFETITEARPGFPGNDPEADMDLKRSDCTSWPPAYRVVKARVAAYSCIKGNSIVYYSARYNGSGSVTLRANYPKSHGSTWDKAVSRMSTSMRQLVRWEVR